MNETITQEQVTAAVTKFNTTHWPPMCKEWNALKEEAVRLTRAFEAQEKAK